VLGDWDNRVSFLKYDNYKLELIDHRIPDQANRL
jgi:hypothetical protein